MEDVSQRANGSAERLKVEERSQVAKGKTREERCDERGQNGVSVRLLWEGVQIKGRIDDPHEGNA